MNIELLQGTLEIAENPGLETIDPRFSDISTLVQNGHYEDAAARAEEILDEHIYDIRIIGYFLYGHFIDQGVLALGDVYRCLAGLLRDNLEALGPVKNRKKHIQNILNWFMKQTIKILQYEETNKEGLYRIWVEGISSDEVQGVLDAADDLRRTLGPVLEDTAGPVLEGLVKINDWLVAFQRLVYREAEPEPEDGAESETAEEEAGAEAEALEEEGPVETRKRADGPARQAGAETAGIEGSYHLRILMAKLEAFDALISAQKFASAAVVADDIHAVIAGFDPRIYFPKLFVGFSRQVAAHINNLAAYAEYKETPSWQALQDLYRTDLETFVAFDPESMEAGGAMGGRDDGGYGGSDAYEDRRPDDDD